MKNKVRFKIRNCIWSMIVLLAITSTALAVGDSQEQAVEIHSINDVSSFDPANITILQGTTVNWTNSDTVIHTVTSDTDIFNSGVINTGQSFTRTFNDIGNFPYHCAVHSFMQGNVNVISMPVFNISGYKINGTDNDGSGIANWKIMFFNSTTGMEIMNTTTDTNGFYSFNNQPNGSYIVTEEMKSGWNNVTPSSVNVNVNGIDVTDQNFTNAMTSLQRFNISGYKVNDANGDGIWDDAETTIPGWNITLTNIATGEMVNTSTDSIGFYNFNNVANGTYIIAEEMKEGWRSTSSPSLEVIVAGLDVTYKNFKNQFNDTILPVINGVMLDTYTPVAGSNVQVTVNATDNFGVSNVAANDIELVQNADDANIWIGTIVAEEGIHSVNVSARDAAGNMAWNNSTTYTGMTDISPPIVNTVILDKYTPFTGDDVLVTVNATDNVEVTGVTANVGIGNVAIDTVELSHQSGDMWSGTIVAREGMHSVNISARDAANNIGWDNSTVYTAINRTFEFTIDRSNMTIDQNEIAQYMLTIQNIGQSSDTYNLTVDNPNNANVNISQTNVTLDPGESSTISMNVTSPTIGTYNVNVTAVSGIDQLNKITVNTKTLVTFPSFITGFSVGDGVRAKSILANVTVINRYNVDHWFVIVVGGTNIRTGYPLVGTGTVHLDANQTIKVPILITVPSSASVGIYKLYAGIFPFDEQILDLNRLIGSIKGPEISTIS